MTTIILLVLGGGIILMLSAAENVPLLQTISDVWNGTVTFGPTPALTRGVKGSTGVVTPFNSTLTTGTGTGGVGVQSTIASGSAAGPTQYSDYRAAVIRAYLQSQR